MVKYLGKAGNLALFSDGVRAVIIDTDLNLVSDVSDYDSLALSRSWTLSNDEPVSDSVIELASASLVSLDSALTAAGDRMYTIPGGVQAEAKKALAWRKEEGRGGTPVGLNTARTLAKGGQIGIRKIRHIAKYFPRHEVDKQGKGWSPGEKNFPSNGRIAWALWGGDAAQRWASAIVERENKKNMTAGGYALSGYEDDLNTYAYEDSYDADINAFKMARELDPYLGPEFMARVRLDNSGIDRLYKVEVDGQVYVWDGAGWDDMGHVDGDVYSYDKSLDEPFDMVEKTHVIIDPSSAIIISAFLQERPFQPVTLDEIDPEETALMSEGLFSEDFNMIDLVLTAAGEAPSSTKEAKDVTDGDGVFTPDERSDLAKKQPRDAGGLFVKVGSRTVVGGDKTRGSGKIDSIDYKTGKVNVLLDNGKKISVDPKQTQPESTAKDSTPARKLTPPPRTTLDGILGKHKPAQGAPKAVLPENVTPMGNDGLKQLLDGWGATIQDQRTTKAAQAAAPSVKEKNESGGEYTVEKGDSLWAIAEKTKADGQSTEDQWLKILEANKDNLKSGNPNLIFAGEKVNIPGQSGAPSAQDAMRKDKQETARADDAAKKKAAADQERIRSAKQEESRDAKNVQEAMRKDKQEVSKAEAAKEKAAADQEKLRNARNADRADVTAKAKAKAAADAKAGMQADKKAISDAEAAKKKATADQEKLRNARNADRVDTAEKAKARAAADAKAGMQADKKAISDAEAAKKKAATDQEKLRNARNADRADTSAKAKANAAQKGKNAMQADKKAASDAEAAKKKADAGRDQVRDARNADRADMTKQKAKDTADAVRDAAREDKKQVSAAEAKAKADSTARSGVQDAKKAESPTITKNEANKAQAGTQGKVSQGKQGDQPAVKAGEISNARKKLEARKDYLRGQRQKYGTYEERVRAAKERNNPTNKLLGGDK